jgi:hypothetical protein
MVPVSIVHDLSRGQNTREDSEWCQKQESNDGLADTILPLHDDPQQVWSRPNLDKTDLGEVS